MKPLCYLIGCDCREADDAPRILLRCHRCDELQEPGVLRGLMALRVIFIVVALLMLTAACASSADYQVSAVVTGYYGSDPGCIGITKTGVDTTTHPDGIAVDGVHIPCGSTISVPGYRGGVPTIADDTGGAMRKDWRRGVVHIDLRFDSHEKAMQWGRQHIVITVHTP